MDLPVYDCLVRLLLAVLVVFISRVEESEHLFGSVFSIIFNDMNNYYYFLSTSQIPVLDLRVFHDHLKNTFRIRHYFILTLSMRKLETVG